MLDLTLDNADLNYWVDAVNYTEFHKNETDLVDEILMVIERKLLQGTEQ